MKDSTSFRSVCKPCHGIQGQKRNRKKLMIKHNVSTDKELDIIIKNNRIKSGLKGAQAMRGKPSKKRKYNYPIDATPKEMSRIRRIKDMGYEPETYNIEWKKRWLLKAKKSRIHKYPKEIAILDRIPQKIQNMLQINKLKDGYIANTLGFKLSEVPQDILELKRKQLKLYRDVKQKHN
jgi:hypothetical protein